MTESVTITIPSSIVNQHLPLLIEKLCQIPNVKIVDDVNEIKIKDIITHLYVDLSGDFSKEVRNKLLGCLSTNSYHHFISFLNWVEDYENEHCMILEYLSQKVNPGIYSSIVEDDDFNKKLVDLLVADEKDDDIDDVLKSYRHAQANHSPILSTESSPNESPREEKANNLPVENGSLTPEEKFESILLSLGLDEAGMTKARKIKADVQGGQSLNMMEIMAFTQEYKTNIEAANLDLPKLMSLVFSTPTNSNPDKSGSTPETPSMPFDLGSIMNTLGPMLSSLTNPQKGKSRRGRRR